MPRVRDAARPLRDRPAGAIVSRQMRFGKRIALPSTAEIKHELRLMNAADAISAKLGITLTLAEVAVLVRQQHASSEPSPSPATEAGLRD